MSRYALITCVALIAWLPTGSASAQQCMVQFDMENSDRHVYGEVAAECAGAWPHDPPWGNWGVDSNVGSRIDGHQFQGIHLTDQKYQWNSCTQGTYEGPNSTYYNYPTSGPNAWTEQFTYTGTNNYGGGYTYYNVSCERFAADEYWGGCRDLDGIRFGPYNNRMSLYELDPWGPDAFVWTLYYDDNDVWAPMTCDSSYCSPSTGQWVTNWNTAVGASSPIRVKVIGAWYIDNPSCGEL